MVTTLLIKGFNDCAEEAGTSVTGGQTVLNPWPIIGGTASATVTEADMIRPGGARPGDMVVLTKPLGTQLAVNAKQWTRSTDKWWPKIRDVITVEQVDAAFADASRSMSHLNRTAARLMRSFGARGATDVTGFGPIGHLSNLAEHSDEHVRIVLERMPVLRGMLAVEDAVGGMFGLRTGRSAETSGGLMIVLPPDQVDGFIAAMAREDTLGWPVWVVGRVEASEDRTAVLAEALEFVPV